MYDDHDEVEHNSHITSYRNFPDYFRRPFWEVTAAENFPSNIYRPLKLVSYYVDYQIGGNEPALYHLSNLVFHTVASVLLYFNLVGLHFGPQTAFFGAAFFALHPMNSEVVYYISGRPDALAAVFFFAAMLMCRVGRPFLSSVGGAAFFGALLCKETVLVLMPALALLAIRSKTRDRKAMFITLAACSLAALAYLLLRQQFARGTPMGIVLQSIQSREALKTWLTYLQFLMLPFGPAGYREVAGASYAENTAASAFFLGVLLLAFVRGRAHSLVNWVGVLFVFSTLFLASALTMSSRVISDRYLYFSVVGLSFLVCAGLGALNRRRILQAALGILLLIFGSFSYLAGKQWKNDFSFWCFAAEMNPNSAVVQRNLGFIFFERGRFDEAEGAYLKALTLSEGVEFNRRTQLKSLHSLGALYYRLGDLDRSRTYYERLLTLDPGQQEHWQFVVTLLLAQNRCQDAEKLVGQANKRFPGRPPLLVPGDLCPKTKKTTNRMD
ncbi:MAG TPA: tetratricopeptide repeat protein [Bdellovibrionota bacterium]|nr:tetratricopeptide repeat protein [Bdellovibrionota bacterium]